MKKYLSIVVALMVTLFAFSSFAFSPPAKPDNGWYVLDQAGKLTSDQVTQLNQKIENLNKTTKNEYAVVILNSLDGSNVEDAAQSTFVSWGVGKKGLDNGVMLLISVGDRKTRIHTGKGAEGDLPDIYCKEILDKTLKPYLKRGQFYDGVNATIDAMSGHMESQVKENAEAPVASSGKSGGCSIVGAVVGGFATLSIVALLVVFFVVRFLMRKAKQTALAMKAILDEQDPVTQPRPTQRSVLLPTVPEAMAPIPVPTVTPVIRRTIPTHAVHPAPVVTPPRPATIAHASGLGSVAAAAGVGAVAVAGLSAVALAEAESARRRKREREEEEERERARKRQRDQEDEDRRRSSSSSSSSWDSGSSFGGGFDSGSGFGGGDSGGGGASSGW
jgi:uncharacterized protein